MTEAELANHSWWAGFWDSVETWAYLGVVLTLAVEFAAHRFAKPHIKALNDAKDIRVALLEKEASDANQKAANIMKAAAWRQLDTGQQETLTKALLAKPDKVLISWVANDPESVALAAQLYSLFIAAKWTVQRSANTYPANLVWGIWVPNGAGPVAEIREAFGNAGIQVVTDTPPNPSMTYGEGPAPGAATILIGSKRPTFSQPPN
jgi:hypothetical protein